MVAPSKKTTRNCGKYQLSAYRGLIRWGAGGVPGRLRQTIRSVVMFLGTAVYDDLLFLSTRSKDLPNDDTSHQLLNVIYHQLADM